VLGRNLQAAFSSYAPVELAEVHITEAQVIEKIGFIGILAEELFQVDAGLIQAAIGEELEGAGEVVLVGHGEICPQNGRGDLYSIIVSLPGSELLKFWFELATSLQRLIAGGNPPLLMHLQTKSR